MKILITGGSGLIGKYVATSLAANYDVTVADKVEPGFDIAYYNIDVTDSSTLGKLVGSFDAILHLAGIPHPLNHPPDLVFQTNTFGTFNVLQFAAQRNIKKVVLASSESTLGFAFARKAHAPLYFPIDEQHPLEPQDPYGLSKVCSEEIMKNYSRGYDIQTIALRFPWVWVPEDNEREVYRKLISDYPEWYKNLWAWVGVHDVVQAFAKAITYNGDRFDRFFITADDNWTGHPSGDLVDEFYPGSQKVRTLKDACSLISSDLAKVVLKYSPLEKVSDILD